MVTPANTTLAAIRSDARDYIGISGQQILPDSVLDQEINYFYTANIPESIKLDQLRDVYVFYTLPYVDTYPVDVNKYQSFREPVMVDGLKATFYKDRGAFYGWWPNVRTYLQIGTGDGVTTTFNFSLAPSPICRSTFMISTTDATGFELICADDGGRQQLFGNLLQVERDSVGNMTPPFPDTSPLPPTPLPNPPYNNVVGQINYVTGVGQVNWPTPPAAGAPLYANYFNASTGRPIAVLYWNNQITVRPIPKRSHKIELETYRTPLQMLNATDRPFLDNFKRYISLGCAINILSRMGDNDRKMELIPDFEAAQGRVLERQANEEIGQANATIFNQQGPYPTSYPYGGYWY